MTRNEVKLRMANFIRLFLYLSGIRGCRLSGCLLIRKVVSERLPRKLQTSRGMCGHKLESVAWFPEASKLV